MAERVFVHETDREVVRFLRSFFKRRKNLRAEFADDVASLREKLSLNREKNRVCIVDVDSLPKLKPATMDCPALLAIIPRSPKAGIRKAAKYGVEDYLISPIQEDDLAFKIKAALERKRTMEDLRKRTDVLRTIVDLTSVVTSTLDPQAILYLIVKKISEVIPVTRCSIVRIDRNEDYADVVASFESPKLERLRLSLNKYPEIKKALSSKRPVIIHDVTTDPIMEKVRDIIFPLGIRSIVVIPIIFHEEVIGTLFLRTSRSGYAFSEHEIELCHAIANASANALYNAFLFEKMEDEKTRLEKLAITDYLTGVYNIRYFYHRIKEEFSRAQRYNLPLSCLMLDIDFFKGINDKYGHRAGDIILREFAQLLKKHARKSDVLARYGGEEFIMLLPQTSESGAVAKAEAMRAFVEKYRCRQLKGKRLLRVSIGVSTYPRKSIKNMDDLISYADDALYKAKTGGRNQVMVCEP
jgi:two-component system cell cycle response regulator